MIVFCVRAIVRQEIADVVAKYEHVQELARSVPQIRSELEQHRREQTEQHARIAAELRTLGAATGELRDTDSRLHERLDRVLGPIR